MAEEAENRRMPKATTAAMLNENDSFLETTLICQELIDAFSEESESGRYTEDLKQDKAVEHMGATSESIKITSSSNTSEMHEVDVLGLSGVSDSASVEKNLPEKSIPKKDSIDDFNTSGQSSYVAVPVTWEQASQIVDVLQQAKGKRPPKVVIFKVDSMPGEILRPKDSAHETKGTITSELQSSHVIEECIDELVKKATNDLNENIQYLASANPIMSRKYSGKMIQLSIQTKSRPGQSKDETCPTISVKDSMQSSDTLGKSDRVEYGFSIAKEGEKKSETSQDIDCLFDELKMKLQKKTLRDIDILSSTVDEIGRMNELFKNEVTSMLSEMTLIRRSARYCHENLCVLEDLPVYARTTFLYTADGAVQAKVNVYDFGVRLLHDLSRIFLKFKTLLVEFNAFRLLFIELSETFSAIPLELHVGEMRAGVLDSALEGAVKIYKVFFSNDNFEILHEQLFRERDIFLSMVVDFDTYLNRLGEHHCASEINA